MSISEKKRDRSLDFLRGSAVIFMIATHSIGVIYGGPSKVMQAIGWWGGTVCFTIFLFVFAAVYGMKLFSGNLNLRHSLKRSILYLAGYYSLALYTYAFRDWRFGALDGIFWSNVWALLRFEYLVWVTEFLLAFVFYIWVILLLHKPLKSILKHPFVTIILGFVLYAGAQYLYGIEWGAGWINILKAHLVGYRDVHSFGLLSYAPVFLLGLVWGYHAKNSTSARKKWALLGFIGWGFVMTVLHITGWVSDERFPPSLLFLSYGLTYTFTGLALFDYIERFRQFEKPVFFVGKHAFSFYAVHILLLIPVGYWHGTTVDSAVKTTFYFVMVMFATAGFITAKNGCGVIDK